FEDDEVVWLWIIVDLFGCVGVVVMVWFGVLMLVEEVEGELLDELDELLDELLFELWLLCCVVCYWWFLCRVVNLVC
ncbi:hypothetical protein GUF79_07105, partial [Xanthomonas citri pv. citri]|nr:hypothetical protein [Xanthomonas citri pv. citri]